MIDHISLGVKDLAVSRRFYDLVLAPLGAALLGGNGVTTLGYGRREPGSKRMFWLALATRPVRPDLESGLHICFDADARAAVDAFHQAGLEAGGADNGAPGLRPEYGSGYYAAFIVDPDGYRLEAYHGAPH
jgi:catechol 2,3-dioxygenase-like lactoylglutathione lyase family enzyme